MTTTRDPNRLGDSFIFPPNFHAVYGEHFSPLN